MRYWQRCHSPSVLSSMGAVGLFLLIFATFGYGSDILMSSSHGRAASEDVVGGDGKRPPLAAIRQAANAARDLIYEPIFPAVARTIIGRQEHSSSKDLRNNAPGEGTVSPGKIDYWRFPSSELHGMLSNEVLLVPPGQDRQGEGARSDRHRELKRQAAEPMLHLTLSVCTQPSPSGPQMNQPPPQLGFLVSWTNQEPGTGPDAHPSPVPVVEGFGRYDNPMSGDVYVAVQAPSATGYSGSYTYEITGSIDTPYSDYLDSTYLHILDSDAGAGLLITGNLTEPDDTEAIQRWIALGPRFSVFTQNTNDTQFAGVRRSYCGLENSAAAKVDVGGLDASSPPNGQTGLTTFGGGAAKQQFYVGNLNRSSTYYAILGLQTNYSTAGSGHPGGGGTVWRHISITTKNEENCQLAHNLSFCTNVNYAVPSHPNISNTQLGQLYDNFTRSMYGNFSYSMQQIPCNTSSDSRYSLAVTCENCTAAYKEWLCAVTMPRCKDYSSTTPYLQARNVAQDFVNGTKASSITADPSFNQSSQLIMALNSSRNPWIDVTIRPGPYKELLPCEGLCNSLVQSCPSALGFACPFAGKGLRQSYGQPSMDGDSPTCNLPGAIWGISWAPSLQPSLVTTAFASAALMIWHFA